MKSAHHQAIFAVEDTHWWYRVRREILHDLLRTYTHTTQPLTIVDIGSGGGALTKELERYGRAVGVDPSDEAVTFARSRGVKEMHRGTANDTGLPAESFDVVVCLDVLEHLPDDRAGIKEIRRILKPGGIAITFVPAFMFLWGRIDEDSEHHRRYRLPELEEQFRNMGFRVIHGSYFNTILFPLIALSRFGERLLGMSGKNDVEKNDGFSNTMLYRIFSLERQLLRSMRFPFGVSAMLIARKP